MTITLTNEQIYVGIIVVLMIIQIYQQRVIRKLERDFTDAWNQVNNLSIVVVGALTEFNNRLATKEEKK